MKKYTGLDISITIFTSTDVVRTSNGDTLDGMIPDGYIFIE